MHSKHATTHHVLTMIGHHITSTDFWSTVFPNWLIAISTVGTVIFALIQSKKGSRDAIKAKQDAVTPIVYPQSIRPLFPDIISDPHLSYVSIGVINFGTGPALNVRVELLTQNQKYQTSMVYRPDVLYAQLQDKKRLTKHPARAKSVSVLF